MSTSTATARGFTLIEVLVALGLLALVSLIAWRGLDAVQHVSERLDERADQTLALVGALSQIEHDVLLHPPPGVMPDLLITNPSAQNEGPVSDLSLMPQGMAWSAQTGLALVRATTSGGWQQVRWYLQDGHLIRAVGPASDRLPLPAVASQVRVMSGVQAWGVRFWLPGQGWVDSSRVIEQTGAPQSYTGLEVSVLRVGQAGTEPYRKVVVLQ